MTICSFCLLKSILCHHRLDIADVHDCLNADVSNELRGLSHQRLTNRFLDARMSYGMRHWKIQLLVAFLSVRMDTGYIAL